MGDKVNTAGWLDTLPSNFVDGPHGKNQSSSSFWNFLGTGILIVQLLEQHHQHH